MLYVDMAFAAVIALLGVVALIGVAGWRHPRHPGAIPGAIFLFITLMAVVWAGAAWSAPYGPMFMGSYFLPYLVVGLVVVLIIMALGAGERPPSRKTQYPETPMEPESAAATAAGVFGLFFWILLIAAAVAVMLRYIS